MPIGDVFRDPELTPEQAELERKATLSALKALSGYQSPEEYRSSHFGLDRDTFTREQARTMLNPSPYSPKFVDKMQERHGEDIVGAFLSTIGSKGPKKIPIADDLETFLEHSRRGTAGKLIDDNLNKLANIAEGLGKIGRVDPHTVNTLKMLANSQTDPERRMEAYKRFYEKLINMARTR